MDLIVEFDSGVKAGLLHLARMEKELSEALDRSTHLLTCKGVEKSQNSLFKEAVIDSDESVKDDTDQDYKIDIACHYLLYLPAFSHGTRRTDMPVASRGRISLQAEVALAERRVPVQSEAYLLGPHPFYVSQKADRFQQNPDSSFDLPRSDNDFDCGPRR